MACQFGVIVRKGTPRPANTKIAQKPQLSTAARPAYLSYSTSNHGESGAATALRVRFECQCGQSPASPPLPPPHLVHESIEQPPDPACRQAKISMT